MRRHFTICFDTEHARSPTFPIRLSENEIREYDSQRFTVKTARSFRFPELLYVRGKTGEIARIEVPLFNEEEIAPGFTKTLYGVVYTFPLKVPLRRQLEFVSGADRLFKKILPGRCETIRKKGRFRYITRSPYRQAVLRKYTSGDPPAGWYRCRKLPMSEVKNREPYDTDLKEVRRKIKDWLMTEYGRILPNLKKKRVWYTKCQVFQSLSDDLARFPEDYFGAWRTRDHKQTRSPFRLTPDAIRKIIQPTRQPSLEVGKLS